MKRPAVMRWPRSVSSTTPLRLAVIIDGDPRQSGLRLALRSRADADDVLRRIAFHLAVANDYAGGDAEVSQSLRDLRVAEVTKMDMKVENGKVTAFRTRVSLSFKYES